MAAKRGKYACDVEHRSAKALRRARSNNHTPPHRQSRAGYYGGKDGRGVCVCARARARARRYGCACVCASMYVSCNYAGMYLCTFVLMHACTYVYNPNPHAHSPAPPADRNRHHLSHLPPRPRPVRNSGCVRVCRHMCACERVCVCVSESVASAHACEWVCPGRVCPTARWDADLTSFTCVQSMRIGARHEGDRGAWDDHVRARHTAALWSIVPRGGTHTKRTRAAGCIACVDPAASAER